MKPDLSVLGKRSIKDIKRTLRDISNYKFKDDCFEEYFELCKKAYLGIQMPCLHFYDPGISDQSGDYGILRARKFEGYLPDNINYFWEPPKEKVRSLGRCNKVGECMFYGANHIGTALIETRAKQEELWFVCNFKLKENEKMICIALGHSNHTIMEQAQNFKESFYTGWEMESIKKHKLVDSFIHRSFRQNITTNSLKYFETIGITKLFLNTDEVNQRIHGITYPSVASGVRGGNFVLLPKYAHQKLSLYRIRLVKILSLNLNEGGFQCLADAKVGPNGDMRWSYRFGSFDRMSFMKLEG